MTINNLFAYQNTRLDVDWNTCGQAAIATMLGFYHLDPFNLPRNAAGHWDDGAIIDALVADGEGADVIFGWGTSPGKIAGALRKYGLQSSEVAFSQYFPRSRSDLFWQLAAFLANDHPCPVLVDIGLLNGPGWTAHWPVAYKVENGRVFLGNCTPPWNSSPTIDQFISAWHAWFLPIGYQWATVYATPPQAGAWSDQPTGVLHTASSGDTIEYDIAAGAAPGNQVEFVLTLGGGVTWKKWLDVTGPAASFQLTAEGAGAISHRVGPAGAVNGLRFSKAGFLGAMTPVLTLGQADTLVGGSRVTFRWAQD